MADDATVPLNYYAAYAQVRLPLILKINYIF